MELGSNFSEFAPPFAGGVMIGAAAVLLMAIHGRIAGISGIVEGVLAPARGEAAWRWAFIGGLAVASITFTGLTGEVPQIVFPHSTPLVAVGGLLVGLGARMGGGCTSGHGVCGIARSSRRSFVATGVFITAGIAVVFIVDHLMPQL